MMNVVVSRSTGRSGVLLMSPMLEKTIPIPSPGSSIAK